MVTELRPALGTAGRDNRQAKEAMALTHTSATVLILPTDAHVDQPLLTVGDGDASFAT